MIHPLHLSHLHWYTVFDMEPEKALETRRRILAEVDDGVMVHAFHFPFPGIGRVVREGEGWRWQGEELGES